MFKRIAKKNWFFYSFIALWLSGIVFICYHVPSSNKQTPETIANRCMSASQVTINNVVFQCKPVGIKLNVTLPSGTETVIYKKFEDASNEAR